MVSRLNNTWLRSLSASEGSGPIALAALHLLSALAREPTERASREIRLFGGLPILVCFHMLESQSCMLEHPTRARLPKAFSDDLFVRNRLLCLFS